MERMFSGKKGFQGEIFRMRRFSGSEGFKRAKVLRERGLTGREGFR